MITSVIYEKFANDGLAFNWLLIKELVNFYSKEEMPCSRTFYAMDISCIVRCNQIGIRSIARFTKFLKENYIKKSDGEHIHDILSIINNERNRNQLSSNIILVPYREHIRGNAFHVVVLVIDINVNEIPRIMCFDGSHFLIYNIKIKKKGSFCTLSMLL